MEFHGLSISMEYLNIGTPKTVHSDSSEDINWGFTSYQYIGHMEMGPSLKVPYK